MDMLMLDTVLAISLTFVILIGMVIAYIIEMLYEDDMYEDE